MKKSLLFAATIATCSAANAGLFDVVKDIAVDVASDVAADYISGLIVDFDANQTEDEKVVADKYKNKHGALPQSPLVSSYKTEVLPGHVSVAPRSRFHPRLNSSSRMDRR